MTNYAEAFGREADFQVRYGYVLPGPNGKRAPLLQHRRTDFQYLDDPASGTSMIWPEFLAPDGTVWPEGEVPSDGIADMYIFDVDQRSFHRPRVSVGVRGLMVEGFWVVAECEVIAVLALADALP